MPPLFSPTRYVSHLLILISIWVFLISQIIPEMIDFAMSRDFLQSGDFVNLALQLVFYQFLHGDIFHILFNGFFLYQIGPEIESRLGQRRYGTVDHREFLIFFLVNTIWVAIALLIFSSGRTVGISGWCMAMLAYLWIDLRSTRHPMQMQIGVMLGINIALGFIGNISLVGHTAGAICGIAWWYWRNQVKHSI